MSLQWLESPGRVRPFAAFVRTNTKPLSHHAGKILAMFGAAIMLGVAPLRAAAAQQADLVLNISDSPDPVPATGLITYSITVTNDAAATATAVQLAFSVPSNARYSGFAGSGIACTGIAINATGPGTLTCTLPNLAFTATTSFTIQLRSTVAGLVTVTGTVSSPVPDVQLSNNTVTETTTAISSADVSLDLGGPLSAASGSTVSYSLSLTNAGPDPATALRIQFPNPTGFAQSGTLPTGCTTASGIVTCLVAGPIASGATLSVGSISGQIVVAAGSTISASASVDVQSGAPVGTAQDPSTANNTDVVSTTVSAGSDLKMVVTRSVAAPYFVGTQFNFVLTASYTGDVPSAITALDTIPAAYTIRTGSFLASQNGWACTVSGQIVSCTRSSGGVAGANQAFGIITIPITVATAGTVTNRAVVTASSPADPNIANNSANDGGATLQTPSADLALSKTGPSPALAVVGQAFTYSMRVTNNGPSAFSGTMVITDTLPVGVTVSSYTVNGWTCTPAAPATGPNIISCQRTYSSGSPLASSNSTLFVVLNASVSIAGSIVNSASLTTVSPSAPDNTPANDRATSTITASLPAGSADLSVVKTSDSTTSAAGEVLTYTLEVVNAGPITANSVTLVDTLSTLITTTVGATGAGYISHTITEGVVTTGTITCTTAASGTGRRLSCTIPSLPVCTAGVDCPRVQVQIRPGGDGGARVNNAWAVSSTTADSTPANNRGTRTTTVLARADVSASLTGTPNPVAAGQELVYVVTAANAGPSQALNVSVVDSLPLGVVFVSAVPSSGSCGTAPVSGTVTNASSREVICALGTILNAAQRTVTIRIRPTTGTRGTTLVNRATAATSTVEPTIPGVTNNSASVSTVVASPSLDLLVNNTDSVDPLTVGDTTAYTITVTNAGPSDAENVVVVDTLPTAGLSFQAYTISIGTCSTVPAANALGGTIVCSIPRLSAGAASTIVVKMRGVVKGVYTNRVTIASDETGLGFEVTGNNAATQATTVRTRADMEVVSKIATSDTVAVRKAFAWTIRVRNNGGTGLAEADTVRLSDTFPSGMELTGTPTISLVSGTAPGAICTGVSGATSFTCQLGTVSSGGILDITVPVRVLTVPVGNISTNTATVTTTSQDLVGLNNSATGSVTILGSSIAGTLFRDFNANGTNDAGDTGIAAITVSLSGTAFDASAVSRSTTTDSNGGFAFINLPKGTYTITRGTVAEALLVVGAQTAGNHGGIASTVPTISAITLDHIDAGAGYLFAYVPQARVGIADRLLGSVVSNSDGTFSAELRVVARNYSRETMSVVVIDSLAGGAPSLGTFVPGGIAAALAAGQYTVETLPSFAAVCSGGTVNGAYDGTTDARLGSIAALPASASCEVAMTVRFKPLSPLPGGGYANQARVAGVGALSGQTPTDLSQNGSVPDPDSDGDPTNNASLTPLPLVLTADVTTTVALPATANAGVPVTATIVYRNLGPNPASTVSYTLQLATGLAGVTFGNLPASATAAYAVNTGLVTFTGMPATLVAGRTASGDSTTGITANYVQPSTATSTVASSVATTTGQGANTAPDAASATAAGSAVADVTTVVAFPASADASAPVSGSVLFRNTGPSPAVGISYGLTLSPGLAGVVIGNLPAGASAAYASVSGVVTFTAFPATLASGAVASGNGTTGVTVAYTQNAAATSAVASSISTTSLQGSNTAPDNASAMVGGSMVADVTTILTFPANVNAGLTVSGAVVFRNNGPSSAAGVSYTLVLTPGLSGVTIGNLPVGATAGYVTGTGSVTLAGMPATLAFGAYASGDGTNGISLSYTQPSSAVSTVTSGISTTTGQGANVALDAASTSPGGAPVADVRALAVLPASAAAGASVRATVSFSNAGPSAASGLSYTLSLTPGLGTVTFGNLPTGSTATYSASTGAVTLTGLPATLAALAIASGDGATGITIDYTQPGLATSTVTSTISTTTNQGANIAPDSSAATVSGATLADVTTSLAFPASITPGNSVSGTVRYSNIGPSTAMGMQYGLTLAVGLGGVAFGNLPGGATASYNAVTGAVIFAGMPATLVANGIASGDGTTGITVNYTQPVALSSVVASHVGTGTNQGEDSATNDATATVTGGLIADVTTTLALPGSVDAGQPVTGTVVFRNVGPSPAAGVTYALSLSLGLTGVAFSNLPTGSSATYSPSTGSVAFSNMPSTIAAGAIISANGTSGITLVYAQPGSANSVATSGITTTTSQGSNLQPDASAAGVEGSPVADVNAQLVFPSAVDAASVVTGRVVFRNVGPSGATGIGYTMSLSPGLAGVTFGNLPAGATATYAPSTGAVTLAGMPLGLASGAIASADSTTGIVVTYTQPGTATSSVNASISASTPQGANTAPDESAAVVTGSAATDVTTVLAFPSRVDAGASVNGTVTFRNIGPSPAEGVTYMLGLSPGLTGVAFTNLPSGATAAYASGTGVVSLSGMAATLASGVMESGNGTSGIAIAYVQPAAANSTVESSITTTTSQGGNLGPDTANAGVELSAVADVTTTHSFPANVLAGFPVSGAVRFMNAGPSLAEGVQYGLSLTSGLSAVAFGNLPAGATATYDSVSGAVVLTGMPASLPANGTASGNGTSGITMAYVQPVAATTISSHIGTSTNQKTNALADEATSSVLVVAVADVTTSLTLPSLANAGELVNGTVMYQNAGPSTAQGTGYALKLSRRLVGVQFANLPPGASATYASATGIVSFAGMTTTLAAGEVASGNHTSGITVAYVQPGTGSSTMTSGISTSTSQGTNAAPDSATASVGTAPVADVTTILTFGQSAREGETVSGTVQYLNRGPSAASDMTYALLLPAGLPGATFAGLPAGATASYASGTGIVTLAGMPMVLDSGRTASADGISGIAVTYLQPSSATSTVAATIGTSVQQGANASSDAATVTIVGAPIADVTTSVAFPTGAAAGSLVDGFVLYQNVGSATAAGMSYELRLSPGLGNVVLSNLPTGATASYASGTGIVSFTGMPVTVVATGIVSGDGIKPIGVRYAQNGEAAGSTIASVIGTSSSQGVNTAPDAAQATVATTATATNLAVTKTTTATVAQLGDTIAYRLRVTNDGPLDISAGSRLTEFPNGLTLETVRCAVITPNRCSNPPSVSALLTGELLPELRSGAVYELAITARVSATTGTVSNRATVAPPAGFTDTNAADNDVTAGPTPVRFGPDLSITQHPTTGLAANSIATFGFTVMNGGVGPSTGPITVTDVLAPGLTFVASTGAGWQCATAGQTVTCTSAAALQPGARLDFALTVQVGPVISGSVSNVATVNTVGDGDRGSKSADAPGALPTPPDISVLKTANTDTLRVGGTVTYALAVRNLGTGPTFAPTLVTDVLPVGLLPSGATGDGFTCSITGQSVSCERAAIIAAGASSTVQVTASVPSGTPPTAIANVACATTSGDANSTNDCGTLTLPVAKLGSLSVRKEAVGAFAVGKLGTFRLWVRNTADTPAPGPIVLVDTLPSGLSFASATGSNWNCTPSAGVVTCTMTSAIAPRDSVSVELVTTVGGIAAASITNCVSMTATDAGLTATGGKSCATVPVISDNKLSVQLTTPRYEREMGDAPQFTAVVRNDGLGSLPAVTLSIALPRGFSYVRGSSRMGAVATTNGDPTVSAGSLSWSVGVLPPGEVVRVIYQAQIGAGAQMDADNVSRASAVAITASGAARSNSAAVPVRLRSGVFTDRGIIAGKVYAVRDSLSNKAQASGNPGIPGVRLLLEDGTGAITDEEGKYNFVGVRAGLHVVKVDRATLPDSAHLIVLENRNAGDAYSRFVDLKAGELARADFADGSGATALIDAVRARRIVSLQSADPARDSINAPVMLIPTTSGSAGARPLVATGLLQARIDLRTMQVGAPQDGFESSLSALRLTGDSDRVVATARAALFLKGDVRSLGRVTLGYDSERDTSAPLFRDIQPDGYFPVYGDAGFREFDAQSRQRLYMQAERGTSYLRYGDLLTPQADDQRMLLAFQRSLTGLQHHVEGARGMLTTFASRAGTRQQLEEIRGRGLSGPYQLRESDAVINSERVDIVTRDRNQPAIVLSTLSMERFTDYSIEPGTGRLIFRVPVPSLDDALNPVSIRVSYEVEQGGEKFLTYGGDGRLQLGQRLEVGALAARDDNPLDQQTLFGASAKAVLRAGTTLFGEVARTQTGAFDVTGDAWHLELRHRSASMEGRVYALQGDSSFINRSSTFVSGRAEYGARWSVALGVGTRVVAEALRTEDVRTDGHRDGASLSVEQRLTDHLRASLGYRWADETVAAATPRTEGIAPIASETARARLTASAPDSARASVFAEFEQSIDGSNAHRGLLGGDYRLFKGTRLYARHEWISSLDGPYALNDQQHQENTVVGLSADVIRNGQMFSEYRANDAFNGRDAEASFGLRNRWQITRGVAANTSFERVTPISGTSDATSLAVTGALAWTRSPLWKGTTRLEWRTSDHGDDFLGSLGYARKVSQDWTMLGRTLWDQRGSTSVRGRSQLGFAWRQTESNKVNALFRLENTLDQTDALGAATDRSMANIATALVNVQPVVGFRYSGRYAIKRAGDRRDGLSSSTTAQLLMARLTQDLTSRFDAGVIGSVLGNSTFSRRQYGVGGELGIVVLRNARIAGGYNVFGFTDNDFSSLGTTSRGPYLDFGFKFDETLFGAVRK